MMMIICFDGSTSIDGSRMYGRELIRIKHIHVIYQINA